MGVKIGENNTSLPLLFAFRRITFCLRTFDPPKGVSHERDNVHLRFAARGFAAAARKQLCTKRVRSELYAGATCLSGPDRGDTRAAEAINAV
jgi:hypothetical protein